MHISSFLKQKTWHLGLAGAVLGWIEWGVFSWLESTDKAQPWALLAIAATVFGLALMTLMPRWRFTHSLLLASGMALLCWLLAGWASRGFADLEQAIGAPQMSIGLFLLATIPLPFMVAASQSQQGWKDYKRLFDLSWNMLFSWATALVFCGIAWIILKACSALLSMVGISALAHLLFNPPGMAIVSGLFIGLGLAIASDESDGYLTPIIFLKLLRLLAPVLLVVMAIFIVALPFQVDLSLPLAVLSGGAVLGAATLISAVVAEDDAHASSSKVLRGTAQALSVLMPVFAAVALWAIWTRIAQHGLTPARVCILTGVAVAGGYGLGYLWAVLQRTRWMASIRRVNIVMALVMVLLAVLWLTRILSPEALSAWSQLSRFRSGEITAEKLPAQEMKSDWGLPGQRAYQALIDQDGIDPKILEHDRETTEHGMTVEQARQILLDKLPSEPANHPLRESFIREYRKWSAPYLAKSCERKTSSGQPACLLVFADLTPTSAGDEAIVLKSGTEDIGNSIDIYAQNDKGHWESVHMIQHGMSSENAENLINSIHANGLKIVPAPFNVLKLEDGYIGTAPSP